MSPQQQQPQFSPDNPYAQQQQPKFSADNPYASQEPGFSPDNPYAQAPAPDGQRPGLGSRYGEAISQIVHHPIDAITGMAKAVLFDALRATVTPVKGLQGLDTPPEFISRLLPDELRQPQSVGQYARSVGLTAANFALPATRSIQGAAALGAGIGAVANPDDPALGAALGGTIGPAAHLFGQGAGAIGRRAGLLKVAKSGAPLPELKIAATAPAPEPVSPTSAIRDLSNADILDMTPEGIKLTSRQAAKEERALFTELFGAKGARQYRRAVRTSTSPEASPEAAAAAQARAQSMYNELTPAQQTALDEVNTKGFTARRLKRIAELTKDYTPENLAKVSDEDLVRQFGEVLMSNKPDRNLAGLYRLRAVYKELDGRGVDATTLLRGTYDYMRAQGIKAEGLGPMILGKMEDVKNTLTKTVPEKVGPGAQAGESYAAQAKRLIDDLPPEAVPTAYDTANRLAPTSPLSAAVRDYIEAQRPELATQRAGLKQDLGTVSEPELQQELADIAPRPAPPVDEEAAARARVEAARTTPFPGQAEPVIQPPISDSPLKARMQEFIQSEIGSVPGHDPTDLIQAARDAGLMEREIKGGYYDRQKVLAGYKYQNGELQPVTRDIVDQWKDYRDKQVNDLQEKLFQTEAIIKRSGEETYNRQRDAIWGSDSRLTSLDKAEDFVKGKIRSLNEEVRAFERQFARGQQGGPGAVEAIKNFAKDETGSLNLNKFTDPLQTHVDMKSLPPHSQAIQSQIENGYDPKAAGSTSPLTPLQTLYRAITRQDVPPEGLRGAFIRRTAPLEKMEKDVQKAIGSKIRQKDLPSTVVQLLSGWAGKAEHFLKYGGFREVGGQIVPTGNAGLEQIFNEAGDLNAFRRLAVSERVAELDAAGRKVETGINPADARMEIANASSQAKAAVGKLHAYLDDVLQYATDSGLLDPNTTAFLRQLGQAYVPLERALKKGTKNLGNVQYSALSTAQQFRSLIGSKLKIIDPLYSTVDYTRRIIRASELNKVGQALVDFTKAHPNETKGWLTRDKNVSASNAPNVVGSGQGIQQIAKQLGINIDLNTAKQIGTVLGDSNLLVEGDIMRVRQGGEIHQYHIDPALGAMLRSLSPQQIEGWLRLAAAPSQALKIGVTANPVFGAFQAFVGAFQSKIQSKYGFRITQDPFIGLYNRVTKSPAYKEALAAGGTSAYLSAVGRDTQSALRNIAPGNIAQKTIRTIAHPLEALRAIADPLEEMNRLGEYIRARKAGADVHEAALAMREVDTDFSQIGTQMTGLAHLVAFANPFIQAGDKAARTLAKNPQAWLSGIMGVTVPGVAFWLAGEGDKEVRDLQRSDQGQRNWFVRLPKTGEIVKIPKPYLYGEIFSNTAEAVMDQMERETPEQWQQLAKGVRDNFSFLMLPTLAQTAIGALSGKNPLGWNDIVPESRAGLEPSLQYTNQSTETARAIGDILNISPAKIDFAIQSLGGTLAQEGMRSLDKLVPDGKATPPAPVSADLPLVGRFFARYPSESVEPIRTFYKNASDAAVKLATARKYMDQMQPERAKAYIEKNREIIGLADAYGKARQELAEKRSFLEKIRDVPDDVMTPQTKRELTDQVLQGMIESARVINDGVRQFRKRQAQQQEVAR